jgi:Transglycosylase SLT domain
MKHLLFILLSFNMAFACSLSPELEGALHEAATTYGLSPALLQALVYQESRYCTDALSPKGAIGLGQLMPGTASALGVDPHDPVQNLHGAAAYLRQQWETFGDWNLALAAYNAGPGAVTEYQGIPPYEETQNYVIHVLDYYTSLSGEGEESGASASQASVAPEPALEGTTDVANPDELATTSETLMSVVITPRVDILVLPPLPLLIAKNVPLRATTLGLETQSGLTLYRRSADNND